MEIGGTLWKAIRKHLLHSFHWVTTTFILVHRPDLGSIQVWLALTYSVSFSLDSEVPVPVRDFREGSN